MSILGEKNWNNVRVPSTYIVYTHQLADNVNSQLANYIIVGCIRVHSFVQCLTTALQSLAVISLAIVTVSQHDLFSSGLMDDSHTSDSNSANL